MDNMLTYYGSVRNGQIKLPKRMRQEISAAFEGRAIEVTVKRKRKRRSNPQNAYYWGVVIQILLRSFREFDPTQEIDEDIVHQYLKETFLPKVIERPQIVLPTAEVVQGIYSTRKLTTTEFMEYLDHILTWAAEFNIIIPDPDPNWTGEVKLEQ